VSWPTTSLLLAAVLWLDGALRRVPANSIVMRRSLLGPWRIVDVVRVSAWRTVGRWPSLVVALVSTEPTRARLSARQIQTRLDAARVPVSILRALGVVTSVVLVFGAPVAVSRYGLAGMYYGAACLLALGIVTACVSSIACRRLDASGWSAVRFGVVYLWPFAGPYAAERVLAHAVAGASPVKVFRLVAGAEAFAQWARPHAYDALNRESSRELRLVDGFGFHLERSKVQELLSILPGLASPETRFCPRCGANFRDDVRECTDCGGIELVASHSVQSLAGKPIARREALSRQGSTSLRRRRRRKR
jgi:hypothetical protein